MIVVNSLPVIIHCASLHASCETWAVEAHEVAVSELGVATNVEVRIDVFSFHVAGVVLGPGGFTIVVWFLQWFGNGKLGQEG